MQVNSVPWSLFSSTVHWRYPDQNHFRHSNRLRTYPDFFQKSGVKRIARWAIWQMGSCSVSANFVSRNTSTVTGYG